MPAIEIRDHITEEEAHQTEEELEQNKEEFEDPSEGEFDARKVEKTLSSQISEALKELTIKVVVQEMKGKLDPKSSDHALNYEEQQKTEKAKNLAGILREAGDRAAKALQDSGYDASDREFLLDVTSRTLGGLGIPLITSLSKVARKNPLLTAAFGYYVYRKVRSSSTLVSAVGNSSGSNDRAHNSINYSSIFGEELATSAKELYLLFSKVTTQSMMNNFASFSKDGRLLSLEKTTILDHILFLSGLIKLYSLEEGFNMRSFDEYADLVSQCSDAYQASGITSLYEKAKDLKYRGQTLPISICTSIVRDALLFNF